MSPEEDLTEEKEKEEKKSSKKRTKEKNQKLQEHLEDIKTKEGIIGYILRTRKSASIDLKDPTRIIDYAVLSSTALETGEVLSRTFELGEIQSVLLEGKDAKLLSLKVEDQHLSVFMEKYVDHEKLCEDLNI